MARTPSNEVISPYVEPVMPDRTDGILGAYDATDVIQEIRYNLRRYEIRKDEEGEMRWLPPEIENVRKIYTKEEIEIHWGNMQTFIAHLKKEGIQFTATDKRVIVYEEGKIVKPLLNRIGEHDIINLLTSFMNRNIYLSSLPGTDKDRSFIFRLTNKFSHDLITLLGVNANKYEIQEPKHISLIVWIVVPNVFAALQMAANAGGRKTLEQILGETKILQQSLMPQPNIGELG